MCWRFLRGRVGRGDFRGDMWKEKGGYSSPCGFQVGLGGGIAEVAGLDPGDQAPALTPLSCVALHK